MTRLLSGQMSEILTLTKAGRLSDATALIQRSLRNCRTSESSSAPVNVFPHELQLSPPSGFSDGAPRRSQQQPSEGNFSTHQFRAGAAVLGYRLYVPAEPQPQMPLVVMLHGCTQSADDFAKGTRMNALAEKGGFLVAYPQQTQAANAQKCWNWFRPGDQERGGGEPALISGITRQIIAEHPVDPARVYVAGLSAGGAAAAIMAASYPDLYAAVGIHSGLACGAARDMPGAFAAMRGSGRLGRASTLRYVPVITFHGENDRTVHPSNSKAIHDLGTTDPHIATLQKTSQDGTSMGGRRYRCDKLIDKQGVSWSEQWHVAGSGHAWSGGSAQGSYTDPSGPDASREMLRFFLQHKVPHQ